MQIDLGMADFNKFYLLSYIGTFAKKKTHLGEYGLSMVRLFLLRLLCLLRLLFSVKCISKTESGSLGH